MNRPGDVTISLRIRPLTPDFVELRTSITEQLADDSQGAHQDQVHLANTQTIRADQLFLRVQDVTNNLAHKATNLILNNKKKG